MSNGTFTYTQEQTVAHFAQFSKAMEMAREGQCDPANVTRALQAIIGRDEIVVASRVAVTPTGKIFHVTGDARSAAKAIEATGCPVKWNVAETPSKIPMSILPVDCHAQIAPLGKTTTTEEIYKIPKIASFNQIFAFAAEFPAEQLDDPIVTVCLDAEGQFWYAILVRRGSGRGVDVDQNHPDDEWDGVCRVLLCE